MNEIRTEIEKRLGVIVTNTSYPPGDVRRYGAEAEDELERLGAETAAELVREAMRS